ncbi:pantetheine-phosphate adenylyltransferase [Raineyella sp. LH-20]|uniref:pantetheine-phosphate adenylyltransferase n=1 Tax=Raineyella sp. LH-20 TaxID=3081204 RepID=UPI002952C1DE|nr:pantetheine-phosphate adenylyltransferase [Raineyella sp. LH-20]WOP18431.1 pantetheine-phosphate adenylyltransferase [Raineyella sp. LH-20]
MKVICPGSFDPVTHGHLDIIERSARSFDEVVVGVGRNTSKNGLFTLDDRLSMLTQACAHLPNVMVDPIDGLLAEYCRTHGVGAIVKGLRFASDFDYELQMAQMNKQLTGVETILLPTAAQWSFVSSTLVREIALMDGDVSTFVPDFVVTALKVQADHRRNEAAAPGEEATS